MREFVAIVPFDRLLPLPAEVLQPLVQGLEPHRPCTISQGPAHSLLVSSGAVTATVSFEEGPMPQEWEVSSLGMANISDDERSRIQRYRAHARLECPDAPPPEPIESVILLVKLGMALCEARGLALCIPASGICVTAPTLQGYAMLNEAGPRAWGVDEAEAALANYECSTLWDSLRNQAEPADLLVGFVPAEIEGRTWFFSAGHTLFGLPELAFIGTAIDEYEAVREFFRLIFRTYFRTPAHLRAGTVLPISDVATLELEPLPARYAEFQASTGTLLVKLTETFLPDKDWDE